MGAPGSPYTRKMLALLRYRNVPYRVEWQSAASAQGTANRPVAKVGLLPTFYIPNEKGEITAVTDSTPLIRRFEEQFEGRHVVPADPAVAFLNTLIEDYADEWLTKAMFHYRWHYEADIKKAGSILPRWRNISASEEEIAPMSQYVSERQISRLSYVGSNETTKPLIEKSFRQFLAVLNTHLQNLPFLFGHRPSSADFAIYGQFTCLALFDPTPSAIILNEFPRLYAWTEMMEDLSGLNIEDVAFLSVAELPDSLRPVMDEIGRIYLPYLKANAETVASGAERLETLIDGHEWTQNPFTYQAKCLVWLADDAAALDDTARQSLTDLLGNSGVLEQLSGR